MLNQRKTEAQNLTVYLHRDELSTVNFSRFYLHIINSEKINKTEIRLARFMIYYEQKLFTIINVY